MVNCQTSTAEQLGSVKLERGSVKKQKQKRFKLFDALSFAAAAAISLKSGLANQNSADLISSQRRVSCA